MKKLAVLNPNTTRQMTDAVVAEVLRHVAGGTEIVGMTAAAGPAVIDSPETFDAGARTALGMLSDVPADADAILLACFGDPGLAALRAAAAVPVVGLAEAAVGAALATGQRFAILTAGAAWVTMLQGCVADYGAAGLLTGVHALPGNGKVLKENPERFRAEVLRLSTVAADDGATMLILGGAAFAGLAFAVDRRLATMDVMGAAIRRLTVEARNRA